MLKHSMNKIKQKKHFPILVPITSYCELCASMSNPYIICSVNYFCTDSNYLYPELVQVPILHSFYIKACNIAQL